ncbi:MAG: helix-turn-helix domain-containing protein [Pseudomonadota bacterium]
MTSAREMVFQRLMHRLTGGVPRFATVADTLAVSSRTLSRRLADEGTTYRQVVDEARAAMAAALLDDPHLSLTEVAYLLGYADPSSFTHAHKRWTGEPPQSRRAAPLNGRRRAAS